jgi:CheY-like chemotaxis protein
MEDDAQIQLMLKGALEDEGYEVRVTSNGKEGKQCWQKEPFELVITDLLMPEKAGFETIRELRRESPNTKIIAISGGIRDFVDTLEIAKRLGANRTFGKPVSLPDFLESVKEMLEPEKLQP